ncbi:MAG: hypothetical protein ABIO70_36890 [Pseudomonadota bacterium]
MILALLLCACMPGNSAPRIEAFNGAEVRRNVFGEIWLDASFDFAPGDHLPFELDAYDPEGDAISTWWPWAPPGFAFDPGGREGAWDVPEDFALDGWSFRAVVVDDAPEPAGEVLEIWFMNMEFSAEGPRR